MAYPSQRTAPGRRGGQVLSRNGPGETPTTSIFCQRRNLPRPEPGRARARGADPGGHRGQPRGSARRGRTARSRSTSPTEPAGSSPHCRSSTDSCGRTPSSARSSSPATPIPGRGMSEHFPFSPAGAALLCNWTDDDYGLGRVHWVNSPDDGENFRATVGLEDARNVLRFERVSRDGRAVRRRAAPRWRARCLQDASAATFRHRRDRRRSRPAGYRAALAADLGVPVERIAVADDQRMHTASLVAALRDGVNSRTGRPCSAHRRGRGDHCRCRAVPHCVRRALEPPRRPHVCCPKQLRAGTTGPSLSRPQAAE